MVFENPEFGKIRTLTSEKGEPLFCGKDVCDVLGGKRADNAIRQHVNILDALKQCIKVSGSLRKDGSRSERRQQMLFVTESGFYALVMEPRHRNAVQMVAGDEQMCKVGRVYTHTSHLAAPPHGGHHGGERQRRGHLDNHHLGCSLFSVALMTR